MGVWSFDAAENSAAQYMRALGYRDAAVTPRGADGGIDVLGSGGLAQVKWHTAPTGRPDIQKLYSARGRRHHLQMLFFSANGYTTQAIRCADELDIALFTIDPAHGLTPRNQPARTMMARATLPTGFRPVPQLSSAQTPAHIQARQERDEAILLPVIACLLVIVSMIREFPKSTALIIAATGATTGLVLLLQHKHDPATGWLITGGLGLAPCCSATRECAAYMPPSRWPAIASDVARPLLHSLDYPVRRR